MTDFSEIEEFPTVPKIFRTEYKFSFNSTRNQECGANCLPNGDFILPPTPSSLIEGDEIYQKLNILPWPIHNEEKNVSVYNKEYLSKPRCPRRSEPLSYLKEWKDGMNFQLTLDKSQNMPEDFVHLSRGNSSGQIMVSQRRSGRLIDDPRGSTEVNKTHSLSKANCPNILIVKPRSKYLTIPKQLPGHRKSVYFQSNEVDEKNSHGIHAADAQEYEHKKPFNFIDNVDLLEDGDNTEGLEANIFDKLSEDTISLYENVSNHLISAYPRAQIQTDNRVDIAVSPIVFLTEKINKRSTDEHGDNLSIINVTGYVTHDKTPLEKISPPTESRKVGSHTQGSTFELVITEPSPIIECSVLKVDNPVHLIQENTHPEVYEQQDYDYNNWKRPMTLEEQKPILYTTVMASESEGSKEVNYNRMNVVVVDDTTSTHHLLPSQNPLMYRGFDDVGYQTQQWFNKRTRISSSSVASVHDTTLVRQDSYHRLLVSSVSSEHRPLQSRNSSCISTLSKSCSSCSSSESNLSHSCHALDESQSIKDKAVVPLREINPLAQQLPSINLIQATPEKKALVPVGHLSTERDLVHLKPDILQNAFEFEGRRVETRELGCSPEENRKRIIQEWLIHRISANVVGHFGSKVTRMLHEGGLHNVDIKEDLKCKDVNQTCLRVPMKEIPGRGQITIGKSHDKSQQLEVSQEHKRSSSVITSTRQSRNEIQPIELIESLESNHNINLNKIYLNNKGVNRQKQLTNGKQSDQRMQLGPRTSAPIVNSKKTDFPKSHDFEEVLEIDPRDDIVKSHLNTHDRRIKSVSMKTGCYLNMKGPIKVPSLDGTLRRDKEVYELTIGAPNKVKADRCINFLRETFPHTAFLRKQAQVRTLNKF
nr:uro adherence factor A [Hymenolepis microstoma]